MLLMDNYLGLAQEPNSTIKWFDKNFVETEWQHCLAIDKRNGEFGNELTCNTNKPFEQ
jgi:hypothetical protein